MFSAIDGGFQVVIKGLFTMDLSWLFCFSSLAMTNIVCFSTKRIKILKDKRANKNG